MKQEWISVKDRLPDNEKEVETIISDAQGPRNEQHLKRLNNLWFSLDMSMYVYYTPTHWRPIA